MLGRIVIDNIRPSTPSGEWPAKAAVGEMVPVSADIFCDGHDKLAARVGWRPAGSDEWNFAPLAAEINDVWRGSLVPTEQGPHEMVVEAWTDHYATWRHKITVKLEAAQQVDVELEEGRLLLGARLAQHVGNGALTAALEAMKNKRAEPYERVAAAFEPEVAALFADPGSDDQVTRSEVLPLWVDRARALFSSWYEVFPRSEGGLAGVIDRLPDIAAMGFDVLYLPPIHPIGESFRKGPNNTLEPGPDDPGSPWAIGGAAGGHTSVHPELGTIEDFEKLVSAAGDHGLEIALDYALQCSPDHPWVKEHPEWFHHRPDGTIAYAENPPKKYQDIYPINFWPEKEKDRVALWNACKEIFDHWIDHGVRIFRVDNPHTKPFAFWGWVIAEVQKAHPDVLFLSEAFTRPKVMAKLAEVGFSQSYTYFTWRTAKWELTEYGNEVAHGRAADYMRPNFWPNTPDILSGILRGGPPAAFKQRAVLASTLVPSWGIYSGYELCENEPASPDNEEYLNSEKYEVKRRDWVRSYSIAPYISALNEFRRRHPAMAQLRNLRFHWADNDQILVYSKHTADFSDVALVVVNLDPVNVQEATLGLDLEALGIPVDQPFNASDALTGHTFPWWGPNPYVRLDPAHHPAHVLHLH